MTAALNTICPLLKSFGVFQFSASLSYKLLQTIKRTNQHKGENWRKHLILIGQFKP